MADISKVIDSTQMPQPFQKMSIQTSRWLKKCYLAMICDLQNLRSGKCICEEGGRTPAIINKNIDLAEKKCFLSYFVD